MGLTILFGSGADTDYCCKLKSSASFNEALLTDKFLEERKKFFKNQAELSNKSNKQSKNQSNYSSHYQLLHPSSKTIFLQTIVANKDEAIKAFGEEGKKIYEKCEQYYDGDFTSNKKDTDIVKQEKESKREYVKKLCKYCYYALQNNDAEALQYKESDFPETQEIKQFFLKNAVFFDTLDEKFNSLRNTEYNARAKKVINAYATVFILMMKTLYDLDSSFSWTYEDLFEKLAKDSEVFRCGKSKKTYYSIVAESGLDCNIVTTNYTDLVKKIIDKNVTYLHGNLKWFEDLQHLTIYDISNEDEKQKALENKEHLIPFILIPSGVKPLICQKQIEQFGEFIKNLGKSDELCVIGYRFNSEDNHINSIIADWLRKYGKHLTYFNFDSKVNLKEVNWLSKEQKEKIEDIPINEDDACEKFEAYIKEKSKI